MDEGSAEWRFALVLGLRRTVERGAEGVDGLALDAERDVGGAVDAGAGEEFLDDDGVDARPVPGGRVGLGRG